MKKVKFVKPVILMAAGIGGMFAGYEQMKPRQMHSDLSFDPARMGVPAAFAGEGSSACDAKIQDAFTSCGRMWNGSSAGGYEHGALKFFNNTLCTLNKGFPAMAEVALCHFVNDMGMKPDKAALPQVIEKSFEGRTVSLVVEAPTESFATSAGYDAKGTVSIDGKTFMALYWGGSKDSSKGFMVQSANGFNSQKNPMYIQWDRTGGDQFVKVFGARYGSSYLGSSAANGEGDEAIFGRASYNKSTGAVSTQTVLVSARRGSEDPAQFGCFRMFASGTKGGNMVIAKTDNATGNTGHSTTSTFTDATEMDAAELTDAPGTANGTGNISGNSGGNFGGKLTVSFDKNCYAVKSGTAFPGGDVSFSYGPSDVF